MPTAFESGDYYPGHNSFAITVFTARFWPEAALRVYNFESSAAVRNAAFGPNSIEAGFNIAPVLRSGRNDRKPRENEPPS